MQDGGQRFVDTAKFTDAPPADPPVPLLNREPKMTPYVPSHPTTSYSYFFPAA